MSAAASPADGLWWNGGQRLRTRIFDAISLLLPSGEQFVIEAVRDVLLAADVPASSRAEARRFIEEECSHQRAHRRDVARVAQHAPVARLEQRIAATSRRLDAFALPNRIALAAAFEVLTGLLAREVLRDGSAWLAAGDAPQQRLWRWHCGEEIAHGHVAVELMRASGVGPWRRGAAFVAAAGCLAGEVSMLLAALCLHDRRSGRSALGELLLQAVAFACRSAPGWWRMGCGAASYLTHGRTPR